MIISSDDLVRRNAAFAATGAFAGLPFPTNDTLQVLGCVDSRVPVPAPRRICGGRRGFPERPSLTARARDSRAAHSAGKQGR